jgi:hypothetical protein
MLDKLIVLHLRDYIKPSGEINQLKAMKKSLKPFSPMTCSRHVYVFFDLTPELRGKLQDYSEHLKKYAKTCDCLCGVESYDFLLRWAVGLESHKLDHKDHFVLGAIRKEWTRFNKNRHAAAKKYSQLMMVLFQDASHVRKLIQCLFFHKSEDYVNKVRLMTRNCTLSRLKGISPLYEKLELPTEEYYPEAITAYISLGKKQIKNLGAADMKRLKP